MVATDLNGGNAKNLEQQVIKWAKVYGNQLYYTLEKQPGLFHYDLNSGQARQLTTMPIDDFYVGEAGLHVINQQLTPVGKAGSLPP